MDEALKKLSEHKNCVQSHSTKKYTTKNRGQSASEKSEDKNRGQFWSGIFPGCFVHVQLAPEFFRSALYTYNSGPEFFRSALYTYNSSPEFFRSALYTYNSCPEVFRSALYTYN
ncbi:MAG: hypothetical protein IPK25_07510 [Saprospiraceae bacterium]|nr:hypothetical protein [Saprospiraceae bacterium]